MPKWQVLKNLYFKSRDKFNLQSLYQSIYSSDMQLISSRFIFNKGNFVSLEKNLIH